MAPVAVDVLVGVLPEAADRPVARLVVGRLLGRLAVGRFAEIHVVVHGEFVGHLPAAGCRLVVRRRVAGGSVGMSPGVDHIVARLLAVGRLVVVLPVIDERPVARLVVGCKVLDTRLVGAEARCGVGKLCLLRREPYSLVVHLLGR